MSRLDLIDAFSLAGVNRANAVVNFTEQDPIDPKAMWLNSQHIFATDPAELAELLLPSMNAAGYHPTPEKMLAVTPLIRERIKTLRDAPAVADFFFETELKEYDPALLIPQKGDAAMAKKVLEKAQEALLNAEFNHDGLDAVLRAAATDLGLKAGQMFSPIRVAACGRKEAPPLFETLAVLGKETTLKRIAAAISKLG
jgi:glutamyl-tRNA synthetase